MSLSKPLLMELEQEGKGTRTSLERIPEDRLDWRPHAKSMTLGELATHLANVGSWTEVTLKQDSFDIDKPRPRQEALPTRAAVLEQFDKNLAETRAALSGVSDEDLLKPWSLMKGEQTVFTQPRVTVHHRAQLAVYLRMLDVPVPGLYGPSADEQAV